VIDYESASSNSSLLSNISLPYLEEQRIGMVITRKFLRLHKENPFELVICNGSYGWYLTGMRLDIPMINIFHGTWAGVNQWLFPNHKEISTELAINIGGLYGRGIFEKISGRGRHNVAVSPLVKDELKRYYGIESEVILNCVDIDLFRPMSKEECRERLKLPKDKKIGFFPSGATFRKGFDIILKLIEKHKDILFILVGKEEKRRNVIGSSRLPFKDMPIYYNASDFVILPSRYEACGLVALEALACNTPVITGKVGIFCNDQYKDLAMVVPTSNWEDYSKAIEKILNRTEEWHSREKIKANFSLDIFSKRYHEFVNRIIG
jgi:glycosyltransferase involved in cell wall biosynthesis